MRKITDEDALEYHRRPPAGKVSVIPTKPTETQFDLSLAYTPGVAVPCLHIAKNPKDVFAYTNKGNLVAVISNGTAVLGLGDIGPMAGKPVMEGKGVLFKRFADIDVFDIELDARTIEEVVAAVKAVAPTFGGINLEDIAAPECFEIERQLKELLPIPVFHDDQHGTAIISGAGLMNAAEVQGKKLNDMRVVFSGAGAAAISCARFYVRLGVRRENITLVDSQGVVHSGRTDLTKEKVEFAHATDARTLADAIKGADVFMGLSKGGLVSKAMVASMAPRPIIFAMANPNPEISYEDATSVRDDLIMATGRSDYPNQVNNVLGFPFIFRGALDVGATNINEQMKVAASHALAALAREDVPDSVISAYGGKSLRFGPDYIIPKPLDPRVLVWEATAVAKAAMESGVATRTIDLVRYREELEARLSARWGVMQPLVRRAKADPKAIVFPEGEEHQILRAVQRLTDLGVCKPVVLGRPKVVAAHIAELGLTCAPKVIDHLDDPLRARLVTRLVALRGRKGVTPSDAEALLRDPNYFGALLVEQGIVDGMLSGWNLAYPETIRPALQVVGTDVDSSVVIGLYVVVLKGRTLFFADTTVNFSPTAEVLAEIAILASKVARRFGVEPRVAMLSFSDFGSTRHPEADRVARATRIAKQLDPALMVDGEMQADTALLEEMRQEIAPFSTLQGSANVLIFPDLDAGNIAYKLIQRLADAELIGPILVGLRKSIHVLQRGDDVDSIVHMATVAVVDAQERAREGR